MRDESIGIVGASVIDPEGIERASTMDLSSLSNSRKLTGRVRAKRGSKGITGHGRALVKDAAYWLQKEYGKERLAFWTVTVPPACLNEELIKNWSKVVKNLKEKLTYHLEKNGLPNHVIGVTEIQTKRYGEGETLPPLHLHIVYVAALQKYVPLLSKSLLANLWGDCLDTYSGVVARRDTISCVQFVRKDVGAYLGKYMSKGFQGAEGVPSGLCPPSWYFASKTIRDIVKGLIVKYSGEWVNELYQYFRNNTDLFKFTKAVEIEIGDGYKIKVGWYGDLKDDDAIELSDYIIKFHAENNGVKYR